MNTLVLPRPLMLVVALAMGMAGTLPALPAQAAPEPPFELAFPQETSKTQFASTFGARRPGGRRHKGNDLMADRLTEVYAAAEGVVTAVSSNRLSGRVVKIDHGDGWMTSYMHLNNDTPGTDDGAAPWSLTVAPGLEAGTVVERGQLIGWVGDSGNAEHTAPHTHFELRYHGRAIDPYRMLLTAYEKDRATELSLLLQIERDLGPRARLEHPGLGHSVE